MSATRAMRRPSSGEKTLAVLSLFTVTRPACTPERAARRLNVSLATAYRYFNALVATGLLERLSRNRYVLGPPSSNSTGKSALPIRCSSWRSR